MINISVVITSAGKGSRTKLGYNKILHEYNGEPIINLTISKFLEINEVKEIIVVISKEDLNLLATKYKLNPKVKYVEGGNTRQLSVTNGVNACSGDMDYCMIHDGARPFISKELIFNIIDRLRSGIDACAVGIEQVDSMRKVIDGIITDVVCRDTVYCMQTPQVAKTKLLKEIINNSVSETYTDEVELLLANKVTVEIIKGEKSNYKITTEEDIRRLDNE